MRPCVRFDDLTPGKESSFVLNGFEEEIIAFTPNDVFPALAKIEELSRSGYWLGGFVCYDAAPGLDSGLVASGLAITSLPLVWFGAYRERLWSEPLKVKDRPSKSAGLDWKADTSQSDYITKIQTIQELIAAGETYQVNHTFRLEAPFLGDPFQLYTDIACSQSSRYCAYLDLGRYQIASASPERFFQVHGDRISVQPMKGTARRGRWLEEDSNLAAGLQESEKDIAENLMIVDLLRNDLGRIARFGSVSVDRLFDLERYETVWQLTSKISAKLRSESGLPQIFAALFPSGSVTGAPKKRTMEIIRDLETSARGLYCGAIGYVAPQKEQPRNALFSVAIRTAIVDSVEGRVDYGVGGGITWDSHADAEHEEAMAKSAVLTVSPRPVELFETLRWQPDFGYFLLEKHLERLEASARYFSFPWCRREAVILLEGAIADLDIPVIVRLFLDQNGNLRFDKRDVENVFGTPEHPGRWVKVVLSQELVSSSDRMLFHKSTFRDCYERRAAAYPDADDVILVNERGEITESTIANVAVRRSSDWITPPLDSGCLPGTYRSELLERGVIREEVMSIDEFRQIPDFVLLNSVSGWRPARLIDLPVP